MPGWEEAHTTIIITMRHIPKAARAEWARVLSSTVDDVCSQSGESRQWLKLYILPCCVLGARPKEQGAMAQSAAKEACKRWRDGQEAELWREAVERKKVAAKRQEKDKAKRSKRGRRRQVEVVEDKEKKQLTRNIERSKMLIEEGQLSRAAKALVSEGMDQDSKEGLRVMRAKHPQVDDAVIPEEDITTPAITITSRQIYEAIDSFKAGSAAGPSGLRGECLKEARGKGRGAAAMTALTKLVNIMVGGGVPREVAPYLFGGNLFALVKKIWRAQTSGGW